MSITVHRMYYGPIGDKGLQLKTTSEVRNGAVISADTQADIYTMKGKFNEVVEDSELLYTNQGPVIRVTRIEPLQSQDRRTTQSCNKTLLVRLSDISNLLLPLLNVEPTFPLEPFTLRVETPCPQPKQESDGGSSQYTG